jgi:purine-binding chemotaxis protein CheW
MATVSPQDGFRVCVFRLGEHRFGLRLESVAEIVPMAALSRPPSMPSILEGFLNLGGTAIPVLRVAGLLGLPPVALELHTPLVVLRDDAVLLALLVDEVTGIASTVADGLVALADSASFNGCVDGQLTAGDDLVLLLSVTRLLLEKERQTLAAFQAVEMERLRQVDQVSS